MDIALKFRAYNKKEQQMYEVFSFCDKIIKVIVGIGTARPIPIEDFEPIMQFTGMVDKNNVEIYEGDIFETSGMRYRMIRHKSGAYELYEITDEMYSSEAYFLFMHHGNLSVVGNIYQNKEMLNQIQK